MIRGRTEKSRIAKTIEDARLDFENHATVVRHQGLHESLMLSIQNMNNDEMIRGSIAKMLIQRIRDLETMITPYEENKINDLRDEFRNEYITACVSMTDHAIDTPTQSG